MASIGELMTFVVKALGRSRFHSIDASMIRINLAG